MMNIFRALALLAVLSNGAIAQNLQVPIGPSGGGGGSGGGSGTITAGATVTSGIASGNLIGSSSNLVVDSGVAYSTLTGGPFLPLAGGTMVGTITAADGSAYGSTGLTGLTALGMSGNITFASGGIVYGVNGTPLSFTIAGVGQTGANNGGNATLRGGNNSQASGTNSGGNVNITGGNASGAGSTGNGGNITLTAGTSVGGTAGAITLASATTLSAALTYGGVTLSNSVTGTGSMVLSASPTLTGTLTYGTGPAILTSPAAASMQLGAADAASPVAQTQRVQSATGTNTSAVNWTQEGSLSTGTGTTGLINFMEGFASLSENATITATSASPGVITYTAHGLVPGASGQFSNSGGALPTGISAATTYYVCKDANYTVNTFDISLTWSNGACGSLINTSSTGSGTNTFTTNTTVQNGASTVVAVGPSGLTGSQNVPALQINQVWNTSAVVDAALQVNVTNIASGAAAKIMDLQINGASNFSVDKTGLTSTAGGYATSFSSNGASNSIAVRNTNNGASATNQIIIGNNTAAAEVAMTLNSSNNSGGNGVNSFTINSAGAFFLQGAGTNAIGISTAQLVTLPALTTDSAQTDDTVCWDTTSKALYFGSGTAGACKGNVSSIRFKPDYALIADGLGVINALDPGTYHYSDAVTDPGRPLRVGFTAERYEQALPQFTYHDAEGRPNGLDMMAALPYAVRAIQQLDERVRELEARAH